jgi:aspartyl-tRNA(Asn)/glutamyl-tRNA(Gln) amidotransferase subunit A
MLRTPLALFSETRSPSPKRGFLGGLNRPSASRPDPMSAFGDEVYFSTAVELHEHLVRKSFTVQELAKAFLERLRTLGPRYNALALLLPDVALTKARAVDKELKRDRARGPLQGVPYGVKDLLSVADYPTTWGAAPFADQVFKESAAVVEKLSKAGAVLTGKLSMVELAGGGGYRYAAASLQGPGLNPWDIRRWSGGSSSGSAAAVAAGLVPYAIGSETSGSIVTPCAYCGVTGLRPTYGLVSRRGAMALAWTMDKIGPIARSAEDCGHVLQAISGSDAEDPGSAGKSFHFAPSLARQLSTLTIGYSIADIDEHAEPGMREPLKAAIEVFRGAGATMVDCSLADFPYSAVSGTVISAEGSTVFEDLIVSGRVNQLADQRQIAGLRAGLEITAAQYLQAMRVRRLIQQSFDEMFGKVDLLLTPARYSIAPLVTEPLDRTTGTNQDSARPGLRAIVPAANLAGLPAIILPCGFSESMPIAVSLVGRSFSENTLVMAGIEFQTRTDWRRKRPPNLAA